MATPEVWRENLERIRRIADGTDVTKVDMEPDEVTEGAKKIAADIEKGAIDLAEALSAMLDVTPEEHKKTVMAGFLHGVMLAIIKIVVDAQANE